MKKNWMEKKNLERIDIQSENEKRNKEKFVNETKTRHYLCESVVKNVRDLTHLFPRATMEAFVQFTHGKRHEQLVVHEFFLGIIIPAIWIKTIPCPMGWTRSTSATRTHWANAHRSLHLYPLHTVFHSWNSTSARGKHPAAWSSTSTVFYVAWHRNVSTYDNNIFWPRVFFFLKDNDENSSLFRIEKNRFFK